jgi:hypothetical protein
MYSEEILNDYSTIRSAGDGWNDLADRYGIEAILLPTDAPVISQAPESGDWCEAYRDEMAVLLLRSCEAQA